MRTPINRAINILIPFCAGLLIGLVPLFIYLFSDFRAFLFNNIGYHNVNAYHFSLLGGEEIITPYEKMVFLRKIFFQRGDNLILFIVAILTLILPINSIQHFKQINRNISEGTILSILLFLIGLPIAIAPTPSHLSYYTVPISFLFLSLIYLIKLNSNGITSLHKKLLIFLLFLSILYNGPVLLESIIKVASVKNWSGVRTHIVAENIRSIIDNEGLDADSKVATLAPSFVLDANIPIYPELATGSFLYRVGDLLSSEERQQFIGTSPKSIHKIFEQDPPAAILVGFEGGLENPLIQYAIENQYYLVEDIEPGIQLFISQP